jgi:hypothetical protein
MSAPTVAFKTELWIFATDMEQLLWKLQTVGKGAAPPLTRREHLWWAWQYLKRQDWEFVWRHSRRALAR